MKREKQLLTMQCLQSGYYRLIDGKLWTKKRKGWQEMKGNMLSSGYRQIWLYNHKRGEAGVKALVYHHIAIYMLINGEYPEGWQIDHKDRNNTNDHPGNLIAVTPRLNIANSKTAKTSDHVKKVIRAAEIAAIKALHGAGLSQSAIARQLNLHRLSVGYIVKKIERGEELKYENWQPASESVQ